MNTLYTHKNENTTTKPDRPEWLAALSVGDAGENAVADLFRRIGLAVEKMQDRCADLEIAGRIEVKTDRQSHRTGRVAVEVSYRGRASGICATGAGAWAFLIQGTGEIILTSTDSLREAIAPLFGTPAGEGATVRLLSLTELRRIGISISGGRM